MSSPRNCPICQYSLADHPPVCPQCGNDLFDQPPLADRQAHEAASRLLKEKREIWNSNFSLLQRLSLELASQQAAIGGIKAEIESTKAAKKSLAERLAAEKSKTEQLQSRLIALRKQLDEASFIELSDDGQILEWRRHFLSDVMGDMGLKSLVLEPALHSRDAHADRRMIIDMDNDQAVFWTWGARWEKVEVRRYGTDGSNDLTTHHKGGPSSFSWQEVSNTEAVELTPYDAACKSGVTVRIPRPASFDQRQIEFFQLLNDRVRVRLPKYVHYKNAHVRRYDISGNLFKLKESKPFDQDGQVVLSLRRSHCVVAVVQKVALDKYRLLDCKGYNGRLLPMGRNEEEWGQISAMVEGRTDATPSGEPELQRFLAQWPARSRARLHYLYEQAGRLFQFDPRTALQSLHRSPRGLLRTLVIYNCGLVVGTTPRETIAQLDYGKFSECLSGLMPVLSKVLTMLNSVAEKQWAIRHANDQALVEAAQWARDRGIGALDRALAMVELRRQAKNLMVRLSGARHAEGGEISELLGRIEEAPWGSVSLSELQAQLKEFEQRV